MRDATAGTTGLELLEDPRRQELERLLCSAQFQNAPLLRSFLEFIAVEAIEGRAAAINEYVIATRVFGRPDDFDPASATIVRTQAYRLRKKLREYYDSVGAGSPLVVEVPKGHYVPEFRPRTPGADSGKQRPWSWRLWLGGVLVSVLLFMAGLAVGLRTERGKEVSGRALTPALRQFWSGFGASRPVIIGYTNPVFYITENGDLLRPPPGLLGNRGESVPFENRAGVRNHPLLRGYSGPLYYEDGFTGAGEVIAVQHLTSVFARGGIPFIVKRSRMVTLDDLKNHNAVFVGSQSLTQAVEEVEVLHRFRFEPLAGPVNLWRGRIVDQADRTRSYSVERHPVTKRLTADHAVVASLPGLLPERRIVFLAGLTTSGTQGAAEFVTSERHMQQLFASPGLNGGGEKYFEAVLRVDATKGLDAMNSLLVAAYPAARR